MSHGPHDAPLGSKPVLPSPEGASADRARRVFASYVGEQRRAQQAAVGVLAQGPTFGGGRRYDVALAKLAALAEASHPSGEAPSPAAIGVEPDPYAKSEVTPPPDESQAARAESAPRPLDAEDTASMPARPPPGAPFIRPSAARPRQEPGLPDEVIASMTDTALLVSDPDGSTSFDLVLSDSVFEGASCRVRVHEGRVTAVFRVRDANQRRLFESESGRLRARLEQRGLRVEEVRVELDDPNGGEAGR